MLFRTRYLIPLVGLSIFLFTSRATAQALSPDSVFQQLSQMGRTEAPTVVEKFNLREGTRACGGFSHVSQKVIWSNQTEDIVAIELYSETCVRKFVIILDGSNGTWSYSGTIALRERDTEPDYKTVELFLNQKPAIVVSNNTVDSGSGMSQQNTQVFAFVAGTLRLVFNEPQKLTLDLPFKPQCCPVQYVEKQTSTFRIIAPTTEKPRGTIVETRHITVNGHSLVQYRRYVWDSRWQNFYSVPFAPTP